MLVYSTGLGSMLHHSAAVASRLPKAEATHALLTTYLRTTESTLPPECPQQCTKKEL